MNRKLNFGRSRHYVNGSQPLTKIGSRDLCKLKFGKTVKCAGGSASKEEVEKLQKEFDDLKAENKRLTDNADGLKVEIDDLKAENKRLTDNADGLKVEIDDLKVFLAAAEDELSKLYIFGNVRSKMLLARGENVIPIVFEPNKRIRFTGGNLQSGNKSFLGGPITRDILIYQYVPDIAKPNIEEVFFMHLNDTTHRFVSFYFDQQSGAIYALDAGWEEGRTALTALDTGVWTDREFLQQISAFRNPAFVKRVDPQSYPISMNNVQPWGLSNLTYKYE